MRVLLATVAVMAGLVATAGAVPPKQCDPVAAKGAGYMVIAHGVKCSFARKWVRRNLAKHSHPKGYSCPKPTSGSNVRVNCQGNTKPSGDAAFRYFYGIKQ